jgi:hypothetical protein
MINIIKKKNTIIKKDKRSPRTFLKESIFEVPYSVKNKKRKVKSEDFEVLTYKNYKKIVENNYNVGQLKSMCRFYKQKVSGNKTELIFLLFNFLKYSSYVIKIQRLFRGHVVRYLTKLRGPAILKRDKCVNETDFYTLENLKELDMSQFYSFTDKDNFVYGFDICSLYNMIVIEKQVKNPYNRSKLPVDKIKNDILNIIKMSLISNQKIKIKLDNDLSQFSKEKQIEMRALTLFQKIDDNGFITDVKWFLNLNRIQLKRYLRELLDIWLYRAQIDNDTKRKINPQHGNPFFSINIHVLMSKCFEVLRTRVLDIIEIFITCGIDADARSLGTYFVLGGLTTVSPPAAISLPWLYESFVQPPINTIN